MGPGHPMPTSSPDGTLKSGTTPADCQCKSAHWPWERSQHASSGSGCPNDPTKPSMHMVHR